MLNDKQQTSFLNWHLIAGKPLQLCLRLNAIFLMVILFLNRIEKD